MLSSLSTTSSPSFTCISTLHLPLSRPIYTFIPSLSFRSSDCSSSSLHLTAVGFMASKKKQDFDVLECSKVNVGKKEAELNLPAGVRFQPGDDELVLFYLFNKILGRTLPITDVIKEIDVYEHDPDQIPPADYRHGGKGNEAFYFTNVEHVYTSEGKGTKRETKGGYWKETDKEKKVTYGDDKVVVGFKTSLLFNKGKRAKAPGGSISPFVMHEYRVNPSIVPVDVLNDTIRQQIERLVVCKIVNKEVEIRDII